MKIDHRFKRRVSGRYEKYDFNIGILKDGPHREPRRPRTITTFRGGPARKAGRSSRLSISQISEFMRRRVNFYVLPIRKPRSRDMRIMVKALGDFLSGKNKSKASVETAMTRVVVNPILQRKYGHNSRATAKAKGFNRFLIDTGQLVKAISAKVSLRRRAGPDV